MNSKFFNLMVKVLEKNVPDINACELLEHHCRQIGKEPEDLRVVDGGILVTSLMSSLSERLRLHEWHNLDQRFKHLLNEETGARIKVKGIVLTGTEEYIAFKRGSNTIDQLRNSVKLPDQYKEDCWYPGNILLEYLLKANEVLLYSESIRSKAIGRYLMTKNIMPRVDFLFGKNQPSTILAFKNIGEILWLNKLLLKKVNDGNFALYFQGDYCEHYKDFLTGLCEGIFEIRNIDPYRVDLLNMLNESAISLKFGKEVRIAM